MIDIKHYGGMWYIATLCADFDPCWKDTERVDFAIDEGGIHFLERKD
jgi:hypothetical protein